MKIALVNSEYPTFSGNGHGGIATYTSTLAQLLAGYGHTVHVFSRCDSSTLPDTSHIRHHRFAYSGNTGIAARIAARFHHSPLAWEQGHARSLAAQLLALTRTEGLDIVEIPEYGGLAHEYVHHSLPPCVITFHTPAELVDRYNGVQPKRQQQRYYRFERRALAHAAGFKSPSRSLKEWVCEQYQLADESIRCIRNPFNPEPLRLIAAPPVADASRFDILFSGRLERRKGAEVLLHSIRAILAIDGSINITIAGETETGISPNYQQAIERILSPGERPRVWFPGPLSRQKLLPLYRNSSLFIFPSLFENSPYALVEAMAAGLPVVATAGSGIGEIITHDETGLLFPAEDRTAFIAQITTLFKNRILASRLGRNAAASIERMFNPDGIVAAHLEHYAAVCGREC